MLSELLTDFHGHTIGEAGVQLLSVTPEQWPEGSAESGVYYSIELHPWSWRSGMVVDDYLSMLDELWSHPKLPPAALGETGLDRLRGNCELAEQERIFERILRWNAEKIGLPLVIHQVRCTAEILSYRRRFATQKWLIHGFNGKPETMEQFLRSGCYVSASVAGWSRPEWSAFLTSHPEYWHLLGVESDTTSGNLLEATQKAAECLKLEHSATLNLLRNNFLAYLSV